MATFDLVDEPWIPCTMLAGNVRKSLGLRDALAQAHHIREIGGDSPLVVAALHRLLLAVLYRSFSLRDTHDWRRLWEGEAWDIDVLHGYFEQWRHRFDLFDGEKPFYQVGSLDYDRGGSSARLFFHMNNNPTLFTHLTTSGPPELAPAEAARLLVGLMAFDTGGLKTSERGQESARAATLTNGAVVLVRGDNLFQTLMLNLCPYAPEDGEPWHFDRETDIPAWERVAETRPEDRRPDGYLDLLTWQSRRVRLQPEVGQNGGTVVKNVVIMKGYQPPGDHTLHGKEAMLAFHSNPEAKRGQDPWPAVTFREGRALWRDSLALMHSANNEWEQPKTLEWLADLATHGIIAHSIMVPVDAFGLGSDRAKIFFWRHERLPLPVSYLEDRLLVEKLQDALDLAETAAQDLNRVIWAMAKKMLAGNEGGNPDRGAIKNLVDHLGADRAYWSRLEGPFKRFMVELPQDRNEHGEYGDRRLPAWMKILRTTLWEAFAEATRGLERSTRTLKALAEAERRLVGRTGKYLRTEEEGDDNDAEVPTESEGEALR